MATGTEIAAWLGGGVAVPSHLTITRAGSPENACPETVVFAVSPGALETALRSRAGLILASGVAVQVAPSDVRVVTVPDARLAFAEIAQHLATARPAEVHPSAVVSSSAVMGANVSIGAGAIIGDGVRIGAGSVIGPRVVMEPGTVVGDRVRVQAGAVLGSLGFGYARRPNGSYVLFPQQGVLVIEDDVEIGANCTIDRGALGETRLCRGTKLDNLVHIGHNCRIGQDVVIAAQTGISGSSVVEDGAVIAGQVGIADHVTIGPGVILGAQCGVPTGKKISGAGELFWGTPARPIRAYLKDLAALARLRKG